MTDLNTPDYKTEFEKLALTLEGCANERPAASEAPSDSAWNAFDGREELLQRSARQRPLQEFRDAVNRAGILVIQAHRDGVLAIDGLAELVAAHEQKEWGGLVAFPSNLFALLIGGPRIELTDADGNVAEYAKPNRGWPLQYVPVEDRDQTSSSFCEQFELPDREQCLLYALACREFAAALPLRLRNQTAEQPGVVKISLGTRSFVLHATDAGRSMTLSELESRVFALFIPNVARAAPDEVIPWQVLNEALGEETSVQSAKLAKLLSILNKRVAGWLQTPDSKSWIGTKKGAGGGRFLNGSVQWDLDASNDIMRMFKLKSKSVGTALVDPRAMAELTPAPGEKLPPKRKSKPGANRIDDDDE